MPNHDSQYDSLRPLLHRHAADVHPYYEDRILVRRLEWPAFERGLIVPDIAKRATGDQFGGVVVAVGPGRTYITDYSTGRTYEMPKRVPCECRPGDKVFYQRVPTNEYVLDGETFTFLFEEQSILAIVGRRSLRHQPSS